jgi:hypothetical protein
MGEAFPARRLARLNIDLRGDEGKGKTFLQAAKPGGRILLATEECQRASSLTGIASP